MKCSAACGDSGMGLRTRRCACPAPAHGGKLCLLPPGVKDAAMLALNQLNEAAKSDTKGESDIAMPTAADMAAIADGSGK